MRVILTPEPLDIGAEGIVVAIDGLSSYVPHGIFIKRIKRIDRDAAGKLLGKSAERKAAEPVVVPEAVCGGASLLSE